MESPPLLARGDCEKKEAGLASLALGIRQRICLEMPNRYLQANLENRRKLAEVIRIHRPDLLFGPVIPDYHPDHIEAAKLVAGARFEAKFHKTDMQGQPHWVKRLHYYYSIHRSNYSGPTFIVDVTDFWDRKIEAIRAYQSQLKSRPVSGHLSVLEMVEVAGRYFGQCIGVKYGEPFTSC